MLEIDLPEVLEEVRAAFARYEQALVGNDVATLDELFWQDARAVRYGVAENLYGHGEISTFRAARDPRGLARTLDRTIITTYGRDFATTMTLFERPSMSGRIGRQSQTWPRTPADWRIVAAHVSLIDRPESPASRLAPTRLEP